MSESWRVLALLASALLWVAVGVAWAVEMGLFMRLRQGWRVCPPLRRTLAALAVAAAVAYAGGKGEGSGGEGVSSKEQVVSAEFSSSVVASDGAQLDVAHHTYSLLLPPSSLSQRSLLPTTYSLSDADISRGYRLVSVVTNEAHSYAMPADARLVGTWHLTDAYDAVARVFLDGSFPLGGQAVTSLWAHVWGRARPQLWNASNELVAVGSPMCARRGVSRLWTAATTNGSVLLTWQDFFFKGASSKEEVVSADGSSSVVAVDGTQLDVDHHTYSLLLATCSFSPVSAQLELFRDGSFVARSNSVARVYRRVNPDDWDGDGIPNAEDDDPRVAADEPRFGPCQSLPSGAHTNNYYWVDLAVRDADALVSFEGDAPSDLPDPSFVARAGETNRVTLLIGKHYTIHSLLPAEVVGTSDPEVEVGADEAGRMTVRWPVRLEYVDAALPLAPRAAGRRASATGRGGTMPRVLPARLCGGVFAWPGNFCCWEAEPDGTPVFACGGACGCGGCSTGEMTFTLEGCAFSFGGWSCSCSHVPPDNPGEEDDGESDPLPGASARFSKRVILFEDEYEDAPGVAVPWRSTETELDCSASGGPNGGRVRIEARGSDGLVPYGGLPLPFERELGPFESVAFKNTYRAVRPSGGEGDIVVTATFEENGAGAAWTSEDRATAVRVKLRARLHAPANDCDFRHRYGVREKVDCIQTPASPTVAWVSSGNGYVRGQEFTCPLNATENPLTARCEDVVYVPNISVLAPSGVEARDVGAIVYNVPIGCAGGIGMEMHFYALPLDVSFAQIAVEEVPNDGGGAVGYFAHSEFRDWWHHDERTGAGNWLDVDECNKIGVDYPRLESELHRMMDNGLFVDDPEFGWRYGELNWDNPFGWNERGTVRHTPEYARFAVDEKQNMVIFETGRTGVRKLQNVVIRDVNGDVYLNGSKVR